MKLILKAKRSGVDAALCTTLDNLFGKLAFFWNPNEIFFKNFKTHIHK